jgi:DNA-binding protein HU-beta
MKKQELIDHIAGRLSGKQNKTEVAATVDALLDVIGDELAADRELTLTGFGKFQVKTRPARKGRNPGTGEEIDISEKKTVNFKPQKALLDKLV